MNKKEKILWDSKRKRRFRTLKVWKKFRDKMIDDNNATCQLCNTSYIGKRKKLLNVHHLFEEEYDNLDPSKFIVLCSSCHFMIEDLIAKYLKGNFHPKLHLEWFKLLDKCGLLTKTNKALIAEKYKEYLTLREKK